MSSEANKQIAKNTAMLYFRMLVTMAVSLYTSRIVLNTLGVEDYGVYNVVGGVVTTFAFIKNAMTSATQRFLSFELGKNDFNKLKDTFNAAIIIHFLIAIIIGFLAETIGIWFLNNYLNIPENRMVAARWVFHFSVFTFIISTIQVPYNAIIIAREKMTFYAYISIVEAILKLIIVFILTRITFDKLKFYGILIFLVALIIAIIYKTYTGKKFEETHFKVIRNKPLYLSLVNFSGWSLFGNLALVGSNQGIGIIMNIFIGVVVNAASGIANQVNTAVYGFISNFQLAFNPQIIKTFAKQNLSEHRKLIYKASKYSFFLLLILATPILFNAEYILTLWLKIIPEYAVDFTKLILISSLIDTLAGPFWMSANATGKIKYYQIGLSFLLLMNLPLSYLALKQGYTPVYVYFIKITLNFLTLIFRIIYVKPLIKIPLGELFKDVFRGVIIVSALSLLLAYFIKEQFFINNSILNLVLFSAIISLFIICCILIFGSNKEERKLIGSLVFKRIK